MYVVSLQNAMPPKIQNCINCKFSGKGNENLVVRAYKCLHIKTTLYDENLVFLYIFSHLSIILSPIFLMKTGRRSSCPRVA